MSSPACMRTALNDGRWRWAGHQMLMTGCPSLVPRGYWWRAEFHLWSQLPLASLWKPSECTHLQGQGAVWVSFCQQYLNSFKFHFLSGEIFFEGERKELKMSMAPEGKRLVWRRCIQSRTGQAWSHRPLGHMDLFGFQNSIYSVAWPCLSF